MKKTIGILLLVLAAAPLGGQTKKHLALAVSAGTALDLSVPSRTPFGWQATGYYAVSNRFSAGAGTGITCYEKTLIPVFAAAKFLLAAPRKFTPYLEAVAGYAFAPGKHANGGIYLNPSVGLQCVAGTQKHVFIALGYESQALERMKQHKNDFFSVAAGERLHHHALSIRAGFIF